MLASRTLTRMVVMLCVSLFAIGSVLGDQAPTPYQSTSNPSRLILDLVRTGGKQARPTPFAPESPAPTKSPKFSVSGFVAPSLTGPIGGLDASMLLPTPMDDLYLGFTLDLQANPLRGTLDATALIGPTVWLPLNETWSIKATAGLGPRLAAGPSSLTGALVFQGDVGLAAKLSPRDEIFGGIRTQSVLFGSPSSEARIVPVLEYFRYF